MDKAALRDDLRARRDAISSADAGERLAEAVLKSGLKFASPIAGFWPIRTEVDVRPLLALLREAGAPLALPRIDNREEGIVFRAFNEKEPTSKDAMAIPAPDRNAEILQPALVFVPLLGFDARGYRLGYGGGYYDRALAKLRAQGPVTAVGLAYAAQEVEEVPREVHDERLDWVITETGARVAPISMHTDD